MQLRKGFTIVELMVVIAIIGIMATISSFAWQRYVNNTNLRMAARELASDINIMKKKAVSKMDTTFTIDFDKTANTYTMNGTTIQTKSPASSGQGSAYIFSLPDVGITAMIIKKQDMKYAVPFGPFLSAAAVTYLFWGNVFMRFLFMGY